MKLSKRGIDRLAEYEGLRLWMYLDSARKPTIGIGHLITPAENASGKIKIGRSWVRWWEGLTEDQAYALFRQDSKIAQNAVNEHVNAWELEPLTQDQYDVLVSFVFNLGETNFVNSTLLKKINAGKFDQVPEQIRRWVYAGGKRNRGLIARRKKEAEDWVRVS